jgi:hypothetical protein
VRGVPRGVGGGRGAQEDDLPQLSWLPRGMHPQVAQGQPALPAVPLRAAGRARAVLGRARGRNTSFALPSALITRTRYGDVTRAYLVEASAEWALSALAGSIPDVMLACFSLPSAPPYVFLARSGTN